VEGNRSIASRLNEFKAVLNGSGFFNLPSDRYSYKANKICDTYNDYISSHEVCNTKGTSTSVFEDIRQAIRKIFLTTYNVWEYTPNRFYISTVQLTSGYYNWNRVNYTSYNVIHSYFDPDGIYFKDNYVTDSWIQTSIFRPYSSFMDAVNKHKIYSDSVCWIRFVAWLPELSISPINPYPRTTSTYYSWSWSYIDTYNYYYTTNNEYNSNYSRPNEFLIFSIILVVVLFISVGVACIIRRNRMNKSQSNDVVFENYLSDNEENNNNPQPVQTSYPIFVSTNPMQSNTQPYPIFVSTNHMQSIPYPQMSNPMQSIPYPQMSNPMQSIPNPTIVFPQPTLFYPQPTNQN